MQETPKGNGEYAYYIRSVDHPEAEIAVKPAKDEVEHSRAWWIGNVAGHVLVFGVLAGILVLAGLGVWDLVR